MQFFFWIAFLLVMGIAIFSVQNSNASPIVMKFFFWSFETSLVYTLLGSFSLGIFVTLLFWIPGTLRASIRVKRLKRELEDLQTRQVQPDTTGPAGPTLRE